MILPKYCHQPKSLGFTLIELIVIISLISILAVSAYSRFTGPSGYAEYTYQARLISALRHIQTRAMFDTRKNLCFQVNFSASPSAFGPPEFSYETPSINSTTCETNIDYSNPDYLVTSATEMADSKVSLVAQDSGGTPYEYIRFDSLGRPQTASGSCNPTCKIELTGESTVKVCVESQGYIHACD
ncbi:prepilin-type N-terminal cleavage/methylation domain-containing protein [Paraglaciecola aquimarina]|uniref:Prepilin-type N-terminal cleavage/methylation domain-containing protein n=1 Tax=Paraglaciecola algarum TaxID=3050085 RepID=A0ABS9D3N2_9ALTE|nr:prepilin-type N-terminal cleavage/methylation domain-containing protein [Paraglaciecola sp. G1-23]MCF2947365.1 prepilin-type N-terminal cleavage/methylation domain-containing protein [Paraglaciecola sp. G1-23]